MTRAVPPTPVPWHPRLCRPHVSCPALFVVAPQDEMPFSVPSVSRVAFERLAGPKAWLEVDGGHFGLLYVPSPAFDRASSAEARFLAQHLVMGDQPARRRASTTVLGHPGGGAADD